MPGLSDAYELKVLDAMLGDKYASAAGIPATTYAALMNVSPTDSTFGTEVSGGGYARVAIVQNASNWPDAVAGTGKRNGVDISFPVASGAWTTANAVALMDHATNSAAANVFMYGNAATARTVASGDSAKIPANSFAVLMD